MAIPSPADDVDPLTLAVVQHKLRAIAEEMVETMARTCFSPILNQSRDFSSVVMDGQARTLAQAERVPIHMGAMPFAIEKMAAAFEGSLRPGDMLIANDPYAGGSHLPDVTMAMPVFDGGAVRFWVGLRAHQGDIGGISPGSYSPAATEIWHEGLRIPPMKLIEEGALRADLLQLLALNSRKGDDLKGDIQAQIAAVRSGAERVAGLIARYGAEASARCAAAVLDSGEAHMLRFLRACRPGHYAGISHLEGEGDEPLIPISASIDLSPERIIVDLRDCPDQMASFLNSPIANTRAAVIVALLYLSDDEGMLNDGATRPLEILTRPGSIVDPREPGPVAACTSLTASAIIEAVLKAMADACPQAAIAGFARRFRFALAGAHAGGEPFIWHFFFNRGGAGANASHEGWPNLGGIHNPGGTPSPSIERTEASYPLVVEEYALREGSGGAGRRRGGEGGVIRIRYEGEGGATIATSGDGVRVPPYGLAGGADGQGHAYWIERADGSRIPLGPRESGAELGPGDRIVCHAAGGGGYGSPE
ncbi:hydantoinase B/oxoprolinase family protein [Afifella sp. IM 167]|uniref:hydantoinase B/oxoprolinase family protein n=1 Tax=Afifella sp. IM 167 TaxID=2033586 RepID=UPI001CCC7872|nr:hydantoinase B/oxoprolinase family protein [Afifella sp. IM 167]MBZ8134817.1 5-oxoprolinase [Afifella sp. IM 167]